MATALPPSGLEPSLGGMMEHVEQARGLRRTRIPLGVFQCIRRRTSSPASSDAAASCGGASI
jgi:hypothetical protein